jgi:hypothetical protein
MLNLVKSVTFGFYYVRLRLAVVFGLHRTANPLDVAWRWRHFDAMRNHRKGHISARRFRA